MSNNNEKLVQHFHSTTVSTKEPHHKGNANILKNNSGEFEHPSIRKITRRLLHKIR